MKPSEKGFTLVELLVAITILFLASGAATAAIIQIFRGIEHNREHITAVRQVQNAGYWISRDTQMALSVNTTAGMTLPDFLGLYWTEWDDEGDPICHSIIYSFEDLTDGIGKLKRTYSSGETSTQTMIAQYIYYNPDDTANTTEVSYASPVLTVRLTALLEETRETKEYKIKRRAGLN